MKSTSRRRPTRKTTTISKKTRKAVTAIAKRVVDGAIETNYASDTLTTGGEPTFIYGDVKPVGAPPQLFDCLPAVSQGDESFQRDGLKISPTKHVVDVDLWFNNAIQDISGTGSVGNCAWDIRAHVWYGYVKKYKNSEDVVANAAALLDQLLDDGQGNYVPMDGTPFVDAQKVNTEVFQLKHKVVRMQRSFGDQNQATLGGGLTTYFPQTIHKRLRLSFKPPKTLLYGEEADLYPQNYAPVIIVGYQHNDFTNASSTVYVPGTPTIDNIPALYLQTRNHLWFKDA